MKVKCINDSIFIDDYPLREFIKGYIFRHGKLYVECYVQQHPLLHKISPSGLNTLRIITLIDKFNKVKIIGTVFRISVNSNVDNFSKGNIAAEIDLVAD